MNNHHNTKDNLWATASTYSLSLKEQMQHTVGRLKAYQQRITMEMQTMESQLSKLHMEMMEVNTHLAQVETLIRHQKLQHQYKQSQLLQTLKHTTKSKSQLSNKYQQLTHQINSTQLASNNNYNIKQKLNCQTVQLHNKVNQQRQALNNIKLHNNNKQRQLTHNNYQIISKSKMIEKMKQQSTNKKQKLQTIRKQITNTIIKLQYQQSLISNNQNNANNIISYNQIQSKQSSYYEGQILANTSVIYHKYQQLESEQQSTQQLLQSIDKLQFTLQQKRQQLKRQHEEQHSIIHKQKLSMQHKNNNVKALTLLQQHKQNILAINQQIRAYLTHNQQVDTRINKLIQEKYQWRQLDCYNSD